MSPLMKGELQGVSACEISNLPCISSFLKEGILNIWLQIQEFDAHPYA